MLRLLLAATAAIALAAPAQALIVIDVAELGPDVVFSFEGSFDVTGLSPFGAGNPNTVVVPSAGALLFAGPVGNMDSYLIASLPAFGTAGGVSGTATGDHFKVFSDDVVGFAVGYAGEEISGALTLSGHSFASLGLIAGTYETGITDGDTIRLVIPDLSAALPPETGPSAPAVPLPATLPLAAAALGALAFFRRRR